MSARADKLWKAFRLYEVYIIYRSISNSISELKYEIEELMKLVRNIAFVQGRNRSLSRGREYRSRSIQRTQI